MKLIKETFLYWAFHFKTYESVQNFCLVTVTGFVKMGSLATWAVTPLLVFSPELDKFTDKDTN